jgi:DnaJ-class molecular chaperone
MLSSRQVLDIWKKVKANGGKFEEFRLCSYCHGTGYKMDRLKSDKDSGKTEECIPCRGWGFVRMGDRPDVKFEKEDR